MKLDDIRKFSAYYITLPAVRLLAKTSITPNTITWFGFLVSVGAAVLIATGNLLAGGLLVLAAGLFDMLDGALARHTSQATRWGGVLDSTLDRIAEVVVLMGLLIFYAREQSTLGVLLVGIALPSSLLVSYIRARAEAAGLECKVGLFTRGERIVVLALGLVLSPFAYILTAALSVIIAFSLVTVIQRLFCVWQQTKG
jgi:CDP-diacylglycerol--glycerol-3-phosphate 3-phosphatidyltransferase